MMNAGLLSITVADEYRARLWSKVFEKLQVHEDIELRKNASIGY